MSLAMILIELRRKSVAVAIFDVSLASQQQQQLMSVRQCCWKSIATHFIEYI